MRKIEIHGGTWGVKRKFTFLDAAPHPPSVPQCPLPRRSFFFCRPTPIAFNGIALKYARTLSNDSAILLFTFNPIIIDYIPHTMLAYTKTVFLFCRHVVTCDDRQAVLTTAMIFLTTGSFSCACQFLNFENRTGGAWSKGRSHLDHCLLIGSLYRRGFFIELISPGNIDFSILSSC